MSAATGDTAHCLNFDELWYSVFEVAPPQAGMAGHGRWRSEDHGTGEVRSVADFLRHHGAAADTFGLREWVEELHYLT